jgi:hypothetical protein
MRSLIAAAVVATLFVTRPARAQAHPDAYNANNVAIPIGQEDKQDDLKTAHSVLQKLTLGSLVVTGGLGVLTAANKDTLMWDGLCGKGNPIFGSFGCSPTGLPLVHFLAGVTTAGLFIATEAVAESMPVSPYAAADGTKEDVMRTLRVINISILIVQPIAGLIAAHPEFIGIPSSARPMFSRVLRTVHMGTGVTLAGTYTATAALQW